jgi:outer membrane protein assembly factor BamB
MKTKHTIAILALGQFAWLASSAPAAAPGDWPQWRGPNRDDLSAETGLLKQWPAGGPALVWKAGGLGTGFSGVSLVGDRIYTMGDKPEASYVLALNRADGRLLWSARVGKAGAPGWGGFAGTRSTPTVDGDLVQVVGQYGEIVCVQAADGKEVWRKHLTDDFGGGRPEWGFAESPLVDGETVLVTPGGPLGTVVALNRKTGAVVWQSKEWTDPAHYSSMLVEEINGVRQYIQLTEKNLAGLSAKDGRVLWKAKRKGSTAVIPTPIYAANHVYVTSSYGTGCNLFKITAQGETFDAVQVYANKVMVNHHGGVVKVGDYLYGHSEDGGWTCQGFLTGEAVWKENEKLHKGSVAYADGHLYCREEDSGVVALVEAAPAGYREKGRFTQPERSKAKSWPHPVVAGGRLYLRDQQLLFCYDLKAK